MKKWLSAGVIPLVFYTSVLQADKSVTPVKGPWFTGPLLTSSANMLPYDNFNIEPYIYAIHYTGTYDADWKKHSNIKFWTYQFQYSVQIGLSSRLQLSLAPQVFYNKIDANHILGLPSASSTQFTDLPVTLGIQIVRAKKEDWYPTIGFQITEIFPTGKYEKLDPLKRRMDVGGLGAYATNFTLLFGKLFHVNGDHGYLSTRGSVGYTIAPPVEVHEVNTYGGGIGTKGHVHPGRVLQGLIGMEYAITLNWVAAIDLNYVHINKTTFRGNPGILAQGVAAKVGFKSSEQFSLAPALEYNISEKVALIAGVWFSVVGRNQFDFTSGVVAFNWYY